MLEVVLQLGSALDPRVANLTNFGRIELLPCPVVKLAVEVLDEFGVYEIEKGIADVAVILDGVGVTL